MSRIDGQTIPSPEQDYRRHPKILAHIWILTNMQGGPRHQFFNGVIGPLFSWLKIKGVSLGCYLPWNKRRFWDHIRKTGDFGVKFYFKNRLLLNNLEKHVCFWFKPMMRQSWKNTSFTDSTQRHDIPFLERQTCPTWTFFEGWITIYPYHSLVYIPTWQP